MCARWEHCSRVRERFERAERSERAEQCSEHSWACSGHVAKISMLRLNIGSGKLSSCMLSIGRGPKAVQGKGGAAPPLPCSHLGPRPMLSMHELSLPEPMLSLSMLILATCPEHAQECVWNIVRHVRNVPGPQEQRSRPTQCAIDLANALALTTPFHRECAQDVARPI